MIQLNQFGCFCFAFEICIQSQQMGHNRYMFFSQPEKKADLTNRRFDLFSFLFFQQQCKHRLSPWNCSLISHIIRIEFWTTNKSRFFLYDNRFVQNYSRKIGKQKCENL